MTRVLLIGLAGALGTLLRYGVALAARSLIGAAFPFGTLCVNLVGCFLIALVSQLAVSTPWVSPDLRLILTTGFIGGLTTYSAFNFETTNLVQQRAAGLGVLYVAVTLFGCLACGALGLLIARRIAGA